MSASGEACIVQEATICTRDNECPADDVCNAGICIKKPPDTCMGGQSIGPDTAGHCCWSMQAWSTTKAGCVGTPQCPPGTVANAEACVAAPPPQPVIEVRVVPAASVEATPEKRVIVFAEPAPVHLRRRSKGMMIGGLIAMSVGGAAMLVSVPLFLTEKSPDHCPLNYLPGSSCVSQAQQGGAIFLVTSGAAALVPGTIVEAIGEAKVRDTAPNKKPPVAITIGPVSASFSAVF